MLKMLNLQAVMTKKSLMILPTVCTLDILVFLKMLRTTVLAVRNTPLTNIPKGFSSKMTLEVA